MRGLITIFIIVMFAFVGLPTPASEESRQLDGTVWGGMLPAIRMV